MGSRSERRWSRYLWKTLKDFLEEVTGTDRSSGKSVSSPVMEGKKGIPGSGNSMCKGTESYGPRTFKIRRNQMPPELFLQVLSN